MINGRPHGVGQWQVRRLSGFEHAPAQGLQQVAQIFTTDPNNPDRASSWCGGYGNDGGVVLRKHGDIVQKKTRPMVKEGGL
jgi:hypothetical protein